jgi:hypothetical protein
MQHQELTRHLSVDPAEVVFAVTMENVLTALVKRLGDEALTLTGYSDENGRANCRESGRCSVLKTATIPVKTASAKRESRGWCFYTVTVSAFRSSIDRFLLIDSPFSSSL